MIFRTTIAIFALCFFAQAQNVKTVMADTNGIIRGNAALEARIATGGTGAASTNDLAALSNRVVVVEASTNNWNTAYGWGNHANAGYLTSFTEADPLWAAWLGTNTYVKTEADPFFASWLGTNDYAKTEADPFFASWRSTNTYVRAEVDPLWSVWLGTNTYVKVELDATALGVIAQYAATNQVKRLHDSQSARYFETLENGTGTTWVITGPFTNLLSVTLSEDFLELSGSSRPAWTNHVFPFVQEPWIGTTSDVTPYATISFNDGDALWHDYAGSGSLSSANGNAQGTATLIPEHTYYTTNIYSTFATEATVSNINASLQARYVSISNQIEALPAALQPYTLTVYGDLVTTNTAGYAGFIATNGAAKSIQIASPTLGLKLAQFRYDITNAEATAYGSADWSSWVQVAAASSNSVTFVRLLVYSAGGALIASNDGARVVSSPASYSNLTASVALPYAVTNGYILTEIYSATNTARTSVIHTGGSYPTTLSFQARPLGYLTSAEAAATYTTPEAVTNIVLDQQQVLATQSDLALKADKSTTLTIGGVTGNLSTNNTWAGGSSVPDGIITNGQVGPLSVGGVTLNTNKIEFTNGDGSTAVYQSGASLVLRAILGERIYFFNGVGAIPAGVSIAGILLFGDKSTLYGDNSEAGINYSGGDLVINPRKVGSGDVSIGGNAALKFGPTIDGKQAHIFSNGTNLYFVNVNYVTNAVTAN